MADGGSDFVGGVSGDCDSVPAQAMKAYEKAKDFSQSCKYAKLSPGKMIAVNDYSAGTPTMYVFNQQGTCVDSMKIDWGRGPGARDDADRKITSCSEPGSYRVPAGMHMTRYHNGKLWPASRSLGMAGLSGQGSYGRAVLIHPSRNGNNAGGPWTIGCTGVPENKFKNLQRTLGYGSLVYNYFGERSRSGAGCDTNRGQELSCGPAEAVPGRLTGRTRMSAEPSSQGRSKKQPSRTEQGAK